MRFRVKCNGQTSKVEVPGTSCSLGQLKAAVVARLFPDDPEAVQALQLSFNNKVDLQSFLTLDSDLAC